MTEATHSFSSRFSRARARARDLPHDAQLLRGHVRLAPRQLEVHVHAAVWHRRGTDGEGRRSEARRQAEGSARQRWRVRRVRRVRGVRRVRAAGRRRGPRVAASRTFRPARPGSRSPASRPSPPARRRWDARGAEGSMAPSGRGVSEPAPSRRVGSPQKRGAALRGLPSGPYLRQVHEMLAQVREPVRGHPVELCQLLRGVRHGVEQLVDGVLRALQLRLVGSIRLCHRHRRSGLAARRQDPAKGCPAARVRGRRRGSGRKKRKGHQRYSRACLVSPTRGRTKRTKRQNK